MHDPSPLRGHPRTFSGAKVRRQSTLNQQVYLFLLPIILLATWITSRTLLELYVGGDLLAYRRLWTALRFSPLTEILALQSQYTGSAEPLFGILAWIGARANLEHDVFMSIINVLLVGAIVLSLRKFDFPVVLLPLILTNYYLLVLIGPAERLKVATFILLLYFVFPGSWRQVFLLMAPAAHAQHILPSSLLYASNLGRSLFRKDDRKIVWFAVSLCIGAVAAIFLYSALSELIRHKFSLASQSGEGALPSYIALILALIMFRHRRAEIACLMLVAASAYLVGGARINLIAAAFLFGLFVSERRYFHPILLILLAYTSYRGVDFIYTVSEYGIGFIQ